MANNKIILGNETLIDLTDDTVEADKLLQGYTAHDSSGSLITGTFVPSAERTPVLLETVEISAFTEQVNRIEIDATKYTLTDYLILYVYGNNVRLSASDWLYFTDGNGATRYFNGSRDKATFTKLFYVKISRWRGVIGVGNNAVFNPAGDNTQLNKIIFYTYSASTKFVSGELNIYAI